MLVSIPPSVLTPSTGNTGGTAQPNISIRIETTQVREDLDAVRSSSRHTSCCDNHMEIQSQKSDDEKSLDDVENQKALELY